MQVIYSHSDVFLIGFFKHKLEGVNSNKNFKYNLFLTLKEFLKYCIDLPHNCSEKKKLIQNMSRVIQFML